MVSNPRVSCMMQMNGVIAIAITRSCAPCLAIIMLSCGLILTVYPICCSMMRMCGVVSGRPCHLQLYLERSEVFIKTRLRLMNTRYGAHSIPRGIVNLKIGSEDTGGRSSWAKGGSGLASRC